MQFDSTVWEAFARAKAELEGNPSVRSVELGWKVSGSELQPLLAVRVYVDRKQAWDSIDPALRIPKSVAGLPTDVVTVRNQELIGHDMVGGDRITRVVWNDEGTGWGTLGYIATRIADSKAVILSNEHVLRNDRESIDRGRELFQPDISCHALGSKCNYVGYAKEGHMAEFPWSRDGINPQPHFIDCAIGEIDKAKFRRGVKEFASIAGSNDISATPTGPGNTPIKVQKMGAKTNLTEGLVVSVNSTGHEKVGPFEIQNQPLIILIRATSGPSYDEKFEVPAAKKTEIVQAFHAAGVPGTVTELSGNRLHFQIPIYFADHGDSGSVIVSSGQVVGLLYAVHILAFTDSTGKDQSVPLGEALACHIGPVMARLGIRIDPSSTPSAGDEQDLADMGIGIRDVELSERIAAIEKQLETSEYGRRLSSLIREHGRELVDLVHHRRHVTVCWHRHHGPAFAALIVEGIRNPERSIPSHHQGVSLTQLLSAMNEVLMREGSPALQADLADNSHWLIQWQSSSGSISELVAALGHENAQKAEYV